MTFEAFVGDGPSVGEGEWLVSYDGNDIGMEINGTNKKKRKERKKEKTNSFNPNSKTFLAFSNICRFS